jgi:LPXTG-motif cell wall-anchored protein
MHVRTLLAPLTVGAIAAVGLVGGVASAASATDIPACTTDQRSQVHAERVGPASFSIYADAPLECGAWVSTFGFDYDYVPTSADDYRHPQTAIDWAFAPLTTTPTVFTVPTPECGPFQSDVYVGDLVLTLEGGELGDKWRAGGVVLDNPVCETEGPPVVVPPTGEPTPPVTTPPVTPPTDEPTAPPATTPPTNVPTDEPTVPVDEPTTPAPTPTATAPVVAPTSGVTPAARTAVKAATTPTADGLAYTGTDSTTVWAATIGALALAFAGLGIMLAARRRQLRAAASEDSE